MKIIIPFVLTQIDLDCCWWWVKEWSLVFRFSGCVGIVSSTRMCTWVCQVVVDVAICDYEVKRFSEPSQNLEGRVETVEHEAVLGEIAG